MGYFHSAILGLLPISVCSKPITMRLTTLLFVIILGCAACSNPQLTVPEAVGHQVFEMLRSVPRSDVNDYMDNFIAIEEIHAMA